MENIKNLIEPEPNAENFEIKADMKFGKRFEEYRTKDSLSRMEWFRDNGYSPRLPDGIDQNSSNEQIKEQIEEEYNQAEYKNISEKLQNDFSEISDNLTKVLQNIFGKNIPTKYDVYLTKYGVGGSYGLPDNIAFNIYNKKGIKTIVHEIVHLTIEENVQKYKLEHFEKERVVDLILHSDEFSFLEYGYWMKNYNSTEEYIDDLFNKYFFKSQDEFFTKVDAAREKHNGS